MRIWLSLNYAWVYPQKYSCVKEKTVGKLFSNYMYLYVIIQCLFEYDFVTIMLTVNKYTSTK